MADLRVEDLAREEGWTLIEPGAPGAVITGAYTSDLLSDVLAHAPAGGILITIQAHRNTVAVAALCRLAAVAICHNRPVPDDMRAMAREEGLALLRTPLDQFEAGLRIAQQLGRVASV